MNAPGQQTVSSATGPAPATPAIALCLSGGGFRATLFHLGAIQRLNELGLLSRVSAIASVSGGSILNGVLATRWGRLRPNTDGVFTNLDAEVGAAVRAFCSADLRTGLLLGTRLKPANLPQLLRDWFSVSANFLADAYEPLYRKTLGCLATPGPTTPRFIFCATNVRTGACWHFHGGPEARMGDFYAGYADASAVRVSDAVAASSAFPPGFSALRLDIPDGATFSRTDPWGKVQPESSKRGTEPAPGGRNKPLLTDGGVYDNLGVEPVWRSYPTLLVSDAGRPFRSVSRTVQALVPRLQRVTDIAMAQVAAVRKRWLVEQFLGGRRTGALWSIDTILEDFRLADTCGYGTTVRPLLHTVRTDLDAFAPGEMACLMNHGYSLADAAVRSRATALCPAKPVSFNWPHREWSDTRVAEGALRRSGHRRLIRDALRYLVSR